MGYEPKEITYTENDLLDFANWSKVFTNTREARESDITEWHLERNKGKCHDVVEIEIRELSVDELILQEWGRSLYKRLSKRDATWKEIKAYLKATEKNQNRFLLSELWPQSNNTPH